jgi:hypothetical protein
MAADPDMATILKAKAGDLMARNRLLDKYRSQLNILTRRWLRAPVPPAAIQGEAMKLFLHALDRYDPNSGVLFKTFMETQLRGMYRYVNANKSVARVPEHRVLQMGRYQRARSLLEMQKGREATHDEMADHLGWSTQQVQMMDTALSRGAYSMAETEERGYQDPITFYNRMGETFEFMYFQMTPEEKLVYDYSIGAHGKPKLKSVTDIARRAGLKPDKVYEIKRRLARRAMKVV